MNRSLLWTHESNQTDHGTTVLRERLQTQFPCKQNRLGKKKNPTLFGKMTNKTMGTDVATGTVQCWQLFTSFPFLLKSKFSQIQIWEIPVNPILSLLHLFSPHLASISH